MSEHPRTAPPRRVRVTSPRMRATRRPPSRSVTRDIDEQTVIGEVYMRSLVRAQLRLAVGVLVGFALALCGLPLLFALAPALRTEQVLGLPLPWLLLGVLAYPLIGLAAWTYVRAAERAERDFADLVGRR
jgi:hypothetical protein